MQTLRRHPWAALVSVLLLAVIASFVSGLYGMNF